MSNNLCEEKDEMGDERQVKLMAEMQKRKLFAAAAYQQALEDVQKLESEHQQQGKAEVEQDAEDRGELSAHYNNILDENQAKLRELFHQLFQDMQQKFETNAPSTVAPALQLKAHLVPT